MAWTTIELIGEEPLQVAHPLEYVGPDGYDLSNVVQFFTAGGNISAWSAAHIVLGAKYADRRMFIIDHGKDGGGVYARLWEHGSGANLHGGLCWLNDTLVCCVQVNPLLLWNESVPLVRPVVRVLHRGN